MKKIIIIYCLIFVFVATAIGCDEEYYSAINSDNVEETADDINADESQNEIEDTLSDVLDEDIEINEEESAKNGSYEKEENDGEKLEEINGELRVDIEVYVNDTYMDVVVYKNTNRIEKAGPDNLSDYTLAQPIMDFLDITYTIDKEADIIILTSKKYGDTTWNYSNVGRFIEDDFYITFSMFRLHTNGSLKQDDYSAMYLYTSDYERTDIPATLEECYTMLDEELDAEDIEIIRNSTDEERIEMHFGLGLWIRNNWLNPTQSKITELIYDNGILHTDDMSALIIEGYYRYLNNEPCSLEELISWYMDN